MNIGILGCGVIGGGVLSLIDNLNDKDLKVVKVFDLPSKKDLLKERFCGDVDELINDKSIDTIVEAMGGATFPYECIIKALNKGKNVITSNKEVVSIHMKEFYSLAKEKGVYFMCEASVGGGIPIICSLIDSVKVNNVNHIYGIINGTTNYVLTRMNVDGVSMEEALEDARKLGFAEYDATADLEGLDMVRKICILSSIAYKKYVPYSSVYHYGITKISKEILKKIKELGYTLKFVAESFNNGDNVNVSVEPILVKSSNPLCSVNYEFNAIYYDCDSNGTLGFYGKGAGRFPTATAMVADAKRILENSPKYYFESKGEIKVDNFCKTADYMVVENGEIKFIKGLAKSENEYDFIARIFGGNL